MVCSNSERPFTTELHMLVMWMGQLHVFSLEGVVQILICYCCI